MPLRQSFYMPNRLRNAVCMCVSRLAWKASAWLGSRAAGAAGHRGVAERLDQAAHVPICEAKHHLNVLHAGG